MKRKSMLFTVTTTLLFLSILILIVSYLGRYNELESMASTSMAGSRMSYIEDDITGKVYSDILSLNVESITEEAYATVIFNHSNLTSDIDHGQLMKDYESFIEGSYSTINNAEITLTNFTNSIFIMPYGSTITVEGGVIYVFTENASSISEVNISVSTGESSNISEGRPSNSGSVDLSVDIDYSGGSFSETASLDPAAANDPFYVNFESGSRVEVRFGSHGGREGTLVLNVSHAAADLSRVSVGYEPSSEKVKVVGGNISISFPVENMTKTSEILISEG